MNGARGSARLAGVALIAAYLLVLQALLGGLSAGAHAGAAYGVDAFGQIICRDAGGGGSPSDPAHHTPDCCIVGCQSSAGAALLPPPAVALARPTALQGETLAPALADLGTPGLQRSPHNARGPPLA